MKRQSKLRRGFTLVEMLFASFIMVFVITIGASIYLMGMQSWLRGESNIESQEGAQVGMQNVISLLRESIYVNVDANGQGLTFNLPSEDANGNIIVPTTWDGVSRRIQLQGTNLVYTWSGGPVEVLATNVSLFDPLSPGGSTPIKIFVPGTGGVTRSLTIMVVQTGAKVMQSGPIYGRRRETLYLRNVPGLLN